MDKVTPEQSNISVQATVAQSELGISPASIGPAGSHFEGQIGADYLLCMLLGGDPRGIPGCNIDRIEFQRGTEGRPLDDVVVHAHDEKGNQAVLEIQVKRSITFSPADPVFSAVVRQISKAAQREDFWKIRYELGIATAQISRKIAGPYQDVLTWAKRLDDAATFTSRINRPGSISEDARTFVQTFKTHLKSAGTADDDETVWKLLRKLHIFVFDYTAQGSASENLARERALRALHDDDASQAGNLWSSLVELALQSAASGGGFKRDTLIEVLRQKPFRLAGDRRYLSTRTALAEAARHALADINDRVGNVMITRSSRVAEVHAACDEGRYIEIRGDAGVGKSGVLKHFAEQMAESSPIIFLSPSRTIPKGWLAMKAALGFDGTLRELLFDLAGSGGRALFIDNLDFFNEDERRTISDFVRETVEVPGFFVITTARRDFGIAEPDWLPKDALEKLGRSTPIVIDELNDAEIDELGRADSRLIGILADNHPAKAVSRNLFRLSRLSSYPTDSPMPRTEVEMADLWWKTADGKMDQNQRERARALKALAEQTILGSDILDTSSYPASAIHALVQSETLRDLGSDRVDFRHDVLREWAAAQLLSSEPKRIESLQTTRPAPAGQARAVEIAARMALEHSTDIASWRALLDTFSKPGVHASWRRAVLLALVRSEIGNTLLDRSSAFLFEGKAHLLCELIRTVMAVDVTPAVKVFADVVDTKLLPPNLNVPAGTSWYCLISWVVLLEDRLPIAALPDVVALYNAWCLGMLGSDPLTPALLPWLHHWLTRIEITRETEDFRVAPFNGELTREQVDALEAELRTGFLMFCGRTQKLARDYLAAVGKYQHSEIVKHSILKFRGALSLVAPQELAKLTADILIREEEAEDEDFGHRGVREPFSYFDSLFMPPSPAQGPFFELLTYAPVHGLALIRQIVAHAVTFHSRGRSYGSNAITLQLSTGSRPFPWVQTYAWSREGGNAPYVVTSALMALEAWGHKRIEAGEDIGKILEDITGQNDAPAAYILLAVDIILSHWPKSRVAAIPFVASPELLCLDRERNLHDNLEYPDIPGLKALQKEPAGGQNTDGLKKRPSRRLQLEQLLGNYALGPREERTSLTALLQQEATRLGPPGEKATLGDPAFMAFHALNLADPANWRKTPVLRKDGSTELEIQYISPPEEDRRFQELQQIANERTKDYNMQSALRRALENPRRSSPTFAADAVAWAQSAKIKDDGDADDIWMHEENILIAALVLARDGSNELRATHELWARDIFARALDKKNDGVHIFRGGLAYNPIATAFVGIVHFIKAANPDDDIRLLLRVSAEKPAAAHGFAVTAEKLATINEGLPRAILRCALAGCIRPSRIWDQPEQEALQEERYSRSIEAAIKGEVEWLFDRKAEPAWPKFSSSRARARRRIRLPGGPIKQEEDAEQIPRRPDFYVDSQRAALWVGGVANLFDVTRTPWLLDMVTAYSSWTSIANGSELEEGADLDNPPTEWNQIYFSLLALCMPSLTHEQADTLALSHITKFPEEIFFDTVTIFVRALDLVFFSNKGLKEEQAVYIRSVLARRLIATHGWKRLGRNRSNSIERHIAPAIASLFFGEYSSFVPARCYLTPMGIDNLPPFIPLLDELLEAGPYTFVALMSLNLFEISPRVMFLSTLVRASKAWLKSYPKEIPFWIDHAIGRRLCALLTAILNHDQNLFKPDQELRSDIDYVLAELVRIGVAEANVLEKVIAVLK